MQRRSSVGFDIRRKQPRGVEKEEEEEEEEEKLIVLLIWLP